MKIETKSLCVNFTHDVVVGNTIEATLVHMAWIHENKNGEVDVDVEVDFSDIENVKFMGVPIDGYEGYKKFKTTMLDLGIDVNKLMDEKASQLITDDVVKQLKQMYKKHSKIGLQSSPSYIHLKIKKNKKVNEKIKQNNKYKLFHNSNK